MFLECYSSYNWKVFHRFSLELPTFNSSNLVCQRVKFIFAKVHVSNFKLDNATICIFRYVYEGGFPCNLKYCRVCNVKSLRYTIPPGVTLGKNVGTTFPLIQGSSSSTKFNYTKKSKRPRCKY